MNAAPGKRNRVIGTSDPVEPHTGVNTSQGAGAAGNPHPTDLSGSQRTTPYQETAAMDAASRALRARLGAHALHAKVEDPVAHTAPARRASLARFEREVDPVRKLGPAERQRRAQHAQRAYMTRRFCRSFEQPMQRLARFMNAEH